MSLVVLSTVNGGLPERVGREEVARGGGEEEVVRGGGERRGREERGKRRWRG